MPDKQQQQGQDNSLDFLWAIAIIVIGMLALWYFQKIYITEAVFYVRYYEILAVKFFYSVFGRFSQLIMSLSELDTLLVYIRNNMGEAVAFKNLAQLSTAVGNYLKYPLGLLIFVEVIILYFGSPEYCFRRTYDMQSLKSSEKENWPQIMPVANLNLVSTKLSEGPWAFSLSPVLFCKKNDLLDVIEENGVKRAVLKRGSAYRDLALQVGPRWHGVEHLPMYLQALFAIFAARINEDKKSADALLDRISSSAAGRNIDFKSTKELLHKYAYSKKVMAIVQRHAYTTTIFASMLVGAREVGVIATSEFIWLKPKDRLMWYMLNSVGRPAAVAEICGAFAHWLAEKKLGVALIVPMVEEAVRGLEVALSEVIYKP